MAEHQEEVPAQKSSPDLQQSINDLADSDGSVQFKDNRQSIISQLQTNANTSSQVNKTAQLQSMANQFTSQQFQPIQKKKNNTGLPDNLKSGIENLSGHSMDDVMVHYNSDKPAQLNAHAYAQGSDIHLGSGQEKHLPHEAWHVVQQKQGRVKPTMQMKGKVNVNDDAGLEKEADLMGAKSAGQLKAFDNYDSTLDNSGNTLKSLSIYSYGEPVQRTIYNMGDDSKLAEKDGASMGKKLDQEVVKIPIPQMSSEGSVLAKATNPFVVMLHGGTLNNMGVIEFKNLLLAKGYPRAKGLDLVLITCSADQILGSRAQMLANELQSKVRAAKGRVVVQSDGTPWVYTNKKSDPNKVIHKDDIFDLMGTMFEDFTSGWHVYTPEPEATLKTVKNDAKRNMIEADGLKSVMDKLLAAKNKAPDPDEIDSLNTRVLKFIDELAVKHGQLITLKGKATNKEMLKWRAIVDNDANYQDWIGAEVDELKNEWDQHNGRNLNFYYPEDDVEIGEEELNAWGDFNLDFSLDDSDTGEVVEASNDDTIQNKLIQPQTAEVHKPKEERVMQRVVKTPQSKLPDGRVVLDLAKNLNDWSKASANKDVVVNILFGDCGSEKWAITQLLMDNKVRIPYEVLTMENLKKKFEIKITLSEAEFKGGKDQIPQLIATLTHEWELHGIQHLLNIEKLKKGEVPDLYIGHGNFFDEGNQPMDNAMDRQIKKADEKDKKGIMSGYMGDAKAHVNIVSEGWSEEDNEKATFFYDALIALKASWKLLNKIEPEDDQKKYESLLLPLINALSDEYFDTKNEDISAAYIAYNLEPSPSEFYSLLIAAYATSIPKGKNEIYEVSRKSLKDNIHKALLTAQGFIDAVKLDEIDEENPREEAMVELGYK